jgi:DNA-binding transcriptional ArsR family regulator
VGANQNLLLQWLDGTSQAVRAPDRWVSARAVARRLAAGADQEAIGRDLTRLQRLGLVELRLQGGSKYFRVAP